MSRDILEGSAETVDYRLKNLDYRYPVIDSAVRVEETVKLKREKNRLISKFSSNDLDLHDISFTIRKRLVISPLMAEA